MEVTDNINNIVQDLLNRYKKAISDSGHVASGKLENTATYRVMFNGKYLEIIFSLQDYWRCLENGTKPTKLLQQTVDGADDLINLIVDEIAKQLQEEINKEEI